MSLTATNAQVYKGTAAVTYGSGSGVSGSQLQGTATVTYGGAPTSNTALSLPGTSGNYMNLGSTSPAHFNTGTSNIFVEGWIYLNNTTGSQVIIESSNTANSTGEDWGFYFYLGTPYSFVYTSTSSYTTPSAAVSSGTWNHLAFAFDSTNNKLYTWTNGTPGAVVSTAGTPKYLASNPVQVGAQLTTGINPLNGYIRDLRVVQGGTVPTTSFTPAQAPFRLNLPPYASGGTTVLSLAEQYFTPSWLSLPGTNGNYITFPSTHPTNFDPSTSNVFVEAWVYWNGANWTATNGGTIYERENAGPTVQDFGLYTDNTGKLTSYMYTQNGSILRATYGTALNVKQWYHVAFGYNIANQTSYVWLNGLVGTTATVSNPARYSTINTFIGNSPLNALSSTTYAWNGYIQDLRVTRGGIIPVTNFTQAAAPFGLASPSYVSGGTTVLSLATQYYQTTTDGLLPRVFLAPSGTYPSYTTTSAPVFNSSNVAFTGAGFSSGNFINFGQTTITMALGYSIVFQFAWTGSYQPAYERIFDFGVAGGNSNAIIIYRNGTGSTINFGNFTGSSAQTITSTSTFPQNTVSGTVVCIYDPASTGSLKMYVNGSLQATLNGITIIPNGSFPSSLIAASNATGLDPFSNVSIYSMKFYNRVLSATEIARTASPISSVQFTNRQILPAVLVNPGAQTFTNGGTVTVAQTALEPANGITWSLAPSGQGVSVASSTDYALTLSTPTAVTQNLFTVSATNKAGLTTVTQFTGATPIFNRISASASGSVVGVYSLRALRSLYSIVVNIRNGTTSATQDFYADTLGNLTTAAGSGQTISAWLGGATGYVTTLYDQTSNGYNLSQATTANQPAINLTTTPYSMIFNGSSTWIYNSSVPFNMGAGSFTLRYVVSNNSGGCVLFKAIGTAFTWSTPYEKKFWLGDGTTNEGSSGIYPSHVGNSEDYVLSSTAITAGVKNSVVHKATARTVVPIYVNGTTASLSRNSINMQNDAGNYFIIGRGGNAAYYNGNLFELQLFSTPLSDADRLLLEN